MAAEAEPLPVPIVPHVRTREISRCSKEADAHRSTDGRGQIPHAHAEVERSPTVGTTFATHIGVREAPKNRSVQRPNRPRRLHHRGNLVTWSATVAPPHPRYFRRQFHATRRSMQGMEADHERLGHHRHPPRPLTAKSRGIFVGVRRKKRRRLARARRKNGRVGDGDARPTHDRAVGRHTRNSRRGRRR